MKINNKILKIFYNALLTGLPPLTYNPYNKNPLHAPLTVKEYSTYINYRLNNDEIDLINKYLDKQPHNFTLEPAKLLASDERESNERESNEREYFLSVNIYNCTSPVFDYISDEPATRCEINTYVMDENKLKGTLIMDYVSNIISIDPDNIFKPSNEISLNKDSKIISGFAKNTNINLNFNYDFANNIQIEQLSSNLIEKSDCIFYNNGLYDKLYYDSSLIHNNIIKCLDNNVEFKFLDINFTNIHSVFYFQNEINFVGGMWFNLNN